MISKSRNTSYQNLVEKKFKIYTGLFLDLPYGEVAQTGMLIPLLAKAAEDGLAKGEEPKAIIESFLDKNVPAASEKERIDLLFRIIQYVERQVVLFDSIEDAAFAETTALSNQLTIRDLHKTNVAEGHRKAFFDLLNSMSVRIVFTAHPTQFYPLEVLDIIGRMREHVKANEIEGVDETLKQLGLTSFINREKPTPYEEALNIIYYLRYIYYPAVGDFYTRLQHHFSGQHRLDNPDLIQIGFWPGGDRDGNPFVKVDTTLRVADELRTNLMKCYYHDVKELERKMTFRGVQEKLADLREQLYNVMFNPQKLLSYEEIHGALLEVRDDVEQNYYGLYLDDLHEVMNKVEIFGVHFARLDIRQDHSVHAQAMEALLSGVGIIDKPLDEIPEEEILEILAETEMRIDPQSCDDPVVVDTLMMIREIREIQRRNGEKGCHRYIMSNSEDILAIAYVYYFFKWSGWEDDIKVDISPLFETMKGMQHSEDIMRRLLSFTWYRDHLRKRGDKQHIMLGFSDGTKDGGYLQANWNIYKTKEVLTKVCREFDVEAIFFDGRGGPPARGGGKTHRFYASLGNEIAHREIQLTIQGQTITSTYGTGERFIHNCEQLLTAAMENSLGDTQAKTLSDENRLLLEELGQKSFSKYDELKHHPKFIGYLENMSTLKYYGKANIGSRPVKRGKAKELTLSDLRAISFVGSWSQLKQNVPGYFGIGTALAEMKKAGKMPALQHMFNTAPFFKALLQNSMMSLSKTYFPLTSYIKKSEEYGDFWQILYDEYELSLKMIMEVSGYERLMQEEPIAWKSIRIRERIVLPLLTIQQYALQKIMQESKDKELYEKLVTRSLYGNINASRNSA